jgi:DNA-binding transcriptional ArsR family regulator
MLRTEKGKPDSTAREILAELAEHADADGRDSFPSVLHMRWATGYDERTVQRALARLEEAELIARRGVTREGCVRWDLDMAQRRPNSDWESLEEEAEKARARETEYRAKHRARLKGADVSGILRTGQTPVDNPIHVHDDRCVRDGEYRCPGFCVPVSGTQRPPNHPLTSPEPPSGGAPPPDPRRPQDPPSSDLGSASENSISIEKQQPAQSETATHDRAREGGRCDEPNCAKGYILLTYPPYFEACPQCMPNVIPFPDRRAS